MKNKLTFGGERTFARFVWVGRRLGSRIGLAAAAVLCVFALTQNTSAITVRATADEGEVMEVVWTLLVTPEFHVRYQCTATSDCYGCNATRGEDYEYWSGTALFQAGTNSKTFEVPTLDDSIDEVNEQFDILCDDMQVKNFHGYPYWVTPSVPIMGLWERYSLRVKIMDNDD